MTKAPFVLLVTDTCKECSNTQINMNAATFEKYLATSTGLIGIQFRQVRHPRLLSGRETIPSSMRNPEVTATGRSMFQAVPEH